MKKPWECDGPPNCPSASILAELRAAEEPHPLIGKIERAIAKMSESDRAQYELDIAREHIGTRHLPAEFVERWLKETGQSLSFGKH